MRVLCVFHSRYTRAGHSRYTRAGHSCAGPDPRRYGLCTYNRVFTVPVFTVPERRLLAVQPSCVRCLTL